MQQQYQQQQQQQRQLPPPPKTWAIVVRGLDKSITVEQVKEKVVGKVSVTMNDVKVNAIRRLKDGGICLKRPVLRWIWRRFDNQKLLSPTGLSWLRRRNRWWSASEVHPEDIQQWGTAGRIEKPQSRSGHTSSRICRINWDCFTCGSR